MNLSPQTDAVRSQEYRSRTIVRDSTRRAWINCEGDHRSARTTALMTAPGELDITLKKQFGHAEGQEIWAANQDKVPEWINQFIADWHWRHIDAPSFHYDRAEPGYEPAFEDDET